MTFETFESAQSFMIIAGFVIAFIMGLIVNKTNFCTMGAISDWVNMGDMGRFRAWLLAIAIALLGVAILERLGMVNVDTTFPPFRNGNLIWFENLFGGILFGIGMTLASGCGNKCLIRIGGGNIKSILVFVIVGVVAYFMMTPFPGSDKTLYSILFYNWVNPLAIDLGDSQDLGALVAAKDHVIYARLIIGLVLTAALFWFVFKSNEFRSSKDNILSGVLVGLCILIAWYLTSNLRIDADGELISLAGYYNEWDMLAESEEGKPAAGATLNSQSFTFISPIGQALGYVLEQFDSSLLTFGIMAVFGVIAGSLTWSLISRSFRIEWFASVRDFITHVIGALLMGFGGVLAVGCTFGQGITGISTLALGSIIAFIGIIFGSALTMKVQYYKLVYEEEASFTKALVAGLVDLKLLPNRLRQLDKV